MIELSIPQVPLSENKIRSLMWTDYGKVQLREIRDMWVDEVWVFIIKNNIRLRNPLIKAKISIKIFFRTKRNSDTLNYPCKEVIDAIKNNGLIIDDNIDVIGRPDIDITGRDSKNPRTEIIIEKRSIK